MDIFKTHIFKFYMRFSKTSACTCNLYEGNVKSSLLIWQKIILYRFDMTVGGLNRWNYQYGLEAVLTQFTEEILWKFFRNIFYSVGFTKPLVITSVSRSVSLPISLCNHFLLPDGFLEIVLFRASFSIMASALSTISTQTAEQRGLRQD